MGLRLCGGRPPPDRYSVTLDVLASLAQGLEMPLSELLTFPVPRPAAASCRRVNRGGSPGPQRQE